MATPFGRLRLAPLGVLLYLYSYFVQFKKDAALPPLGVHTIINKSRRNIYFLFRLPLITIPLPFFLEP